MIQEYFVNLNNYDGNKAYFGIERYTIMGIDNTKYAFPSDFDLIKLAREANGEKKKELENRYPIFQILNEYPDICEARAVKVNFKRNDLMNKLASGG